MKKYRKPVQSKGYRNVFCPYYRNCLDHASKKYWEYWSCFHCRHKHLQESIADESVSPASTDTYYSISPSIGEKLKNITL
jgi:hypothetical protein